MDARQETIKRIKNILRFHRKGLTITEISEKLHLNRNSTAKYLEILLISGEVELNTIGPAKVYTYSQKMPISAIMKFSADIILLIDNEMHVLDANENALKILETSRQELIGDLVQNIKSPLISRLTFPEVLEEIRIKGEILREFNISQHNEDHHYRVRLIPTVFDNQDEGITIIGEDITKQIRFEESLMISEARYRAIVEDQNEFICRFTPDGKLTYFNEAYSRYFKLNKEKCIGHRHTVSLPPDDAKKMAIHLASLTPENPVKTIEHRINMPGGDVVWHFWSDRAIFNPDGMVCEYLSVGRDITKRKVVEEALSQSESLYRTILDNIRDVYYRCDLDGTLVMISRSAIKLFGYDSLEEMIGKNIADTFYFSPKDRKTFLAILNTEQEVTDYEVLLKKRDGEPIVVSTNSHIITDSAGNTTGIEGIFRDITFRKQAEKNLKESEERYHMISDHSPFPISIADKSGTLLYINKKFTHLFGYSLDDIPTEKDWFSLAFPDESVRKEAIIAWIHDSVDSAESEVGLHVFPIKCKDGIIRYINVFRATLHSGEHFVVYEDITPKKESERLHSMLASIVNTSNDAITLYRNLNDSVPNQR